MPIRRLNDYQRVVELQQQSHQGGAPLHAREHVGAVALEPARRLVAGQAVLAVALSSTSVS